MNPAVGTTLTLLFTDLVNSTEVSVRLGAEAHALRRAHDRILREQFDAHGGNMVKNTGDGFFVTFTSARQAAACASSIQQAIAREQSEGRYPDLAVRIGLHTGEPVREDDDYFGVDVALASRIMGEAAGGEILVSDITYLLARAAGAARFEDAGARTLKGVSEPVALYRLRWDVEPQQSHLSRFIGRASERARLSSRLDAAMHGHGSLVLITGDGGLGKTRLADELCVEARDHGMVVLSGRAFDTEAQLPYHVVSDALRSWFRDRTDAEIRELLGDDAPLLARIMPELREAAPDAEPPSGQAAEAERYRLFEAITRTLLSIVERAPGVLFLDDLHWADRATAHLVEHLARRVSQASLLIVAAYRDVELPHDHPLAAIAFDIERRAAGERIALSPLSRDDALALAAEVLGRPLSPATADALYAATEGNPFFTEELVRLMLDRAGDAAAPAPSWDVPDSVRHLLLQRIEKLSEVTRDVLATCAVLGRDFTTARIAAATGVDADELITALNDALDANVLREERDSYVFAHPLIGEAVYQSLRGPRRQLLHRRIAAGLERLYGAELDVHVQELAHHHLEAARGGADVAPAVRYARRAAEHAAAVYAYDEAASYYRRAAGAVRAAGAASAECCDLLLLLGDMQTKAGDAPGADTTFHEAAELARASGRGDQLARAALGLGDVRRSGGIVDEPLMAMLDDAVHALEPGDSVLRARVLARLSAAQYLSKPLAQLHEQAVEAAEMAERLDDDETRLYVWRTIRLLKQDQHDAAGRLSDARELARFAARIGDREAALYARHMQIDTLIELGETADADALIDVFEQEAQALRQPFYIWLGQVYRGMRALLAGRWIDAEALAQMAFETGSQAQTETNLAMQFLSAQLYAARLEQGRLGELLPILRESARQYPAVRWRVALAFALSETGDHAAALDEFHAIVTPEACDVPDDYNQSVLLVFLADLADRYDDAKRARVIYERLLPFNGRNVVVGAPATCAGAAARLLGLLAGVLGRWDEVERYFEDALELNTRLQSPPLVAWTQFNFATTLLRRRQSGDAKRAARLLEEAADTADALGMARLHERVRGVTKEAVQG